MKNALDKYIGKLGTTIVDSSIQFAVNFMYQTSIINDGSERSARVLVMELRYFPPLQLLIQKLGIEYCMRIKIFALRALRTQYI